MVADATGRVILPVRVILHTFFLSWLLHQIKLLQRAIPIILKKMIFQRLRQLHIL